MKEVALFTAVSIMILLSAYMANEIKEAEMKSKEAANATKSAANDIKVEDYYYSAQIAQHLHKMNREYRSEKRKVNKVNGIAYTERVAHGVRPTCNVTDAVLVASGVDGDGLAVEYTNVAW